MLCSHHTPAAEQRQQRPLFPHNLQFSEVHSLSKCELDPQQRLVFRSVPGENRGWYLRACCVWLDLWPPHPSPDGTRLTAASAARFTPLALAPAVPHL